MTLKKIFASSVAALAVAAALLLGAQRVAAAGNSTGNADNGIVDITTNLAYEDSAAAGTGMVLTSTGEVLTNNHVIRGATTIKVTDTSTGKTYAAKVVGYDLSVDVAVLQLTNASGLKTVNLGDSSTVKVGDAVVGLGNAGGVGGTPIAANGTVEALGQSITAGDDDGTSEHLTGLIGTNAGIQPGDSGGPLENASGQVIGMDTAASTATGFGFQSNGSQAFAIPINTALAVAKQIEAGHSTTAHIGATAFLGIEVQPAGFLRGQTVSGALIAGVVKASPASRAGLANGDVIVGLNTHTILSATSLTSLLQKQFPGSKVKIHWVDQLGTGHSATVTLASGPPQ